MGESPQTGQQAEQRALVADLVRTQAVLQARSEQLQEIFASRWYRLARLMWRLRRGALLRKAGPPRMAAEGSFAQPLDGATAELDRAPQPGAPAGAPLPGLEPPRADAGPEGEPPRGGETRLLLAGHSLSFCEGIARRARQRGATVREDRWRTHGAHEEEASAAALAWADVIHCEWCLGNAVWYSRGKRPGQRLVVRFHRMELDTPYPGEVDLDQVDAMVFVAPHVLEQACEQRGWDPEDARFAIVPNGVDLGALQRPKPPGARYSLGAVGYVPRLKRIDRALDLLELLRRHDRRYRLVIKGREPWEHGWMAARDEERGYYEDLSRRVEQAPGLRGAVDFESFGDDVPAFLRQVGWLLSTSEVEGHSVALAEGMASGAAPVILDRPGARDQYEERWVHGDVAAAAEAILAVESRGELAVEGEAARQFAERWSWERQGPVWDELLAAPARPPRRPAAAASKRT
jgi:glycosyltransferase involved in cell wall biosynthesis